MLLLEKDYNSLKVQMMVSIFFFLNICWAASSHMNRAGFISTVTAGLVILLAMAFLPTVLRCWARISAAPPAHTPGQLKPRAG